MNRSADFSPQEGGARARGTAPKRHGRRPNLSAAQLDELIEEATVDAYGESEQVVGFYTMIEERLAFPFKTDLLGVQVTVERLDLSDDGQIVAVCAHGRARQRVGILDLALPIPPPEGAEWIAAYRRWARGR